MAAHFNILAWRIPWTEEPGGLQLMGRKELGMTEQPALSLSILIAFLTPVVLHKLEARSFTQAVLH